MVEVTNEKELEKAIEKRLQEVLTEFEIKAIQQLQFYINTLFYDQYVPKQYVRTYQLRDEMPYSQILFQQNQEYCFLLKLGMNSDVAHYVIKSEEVLLNSALGKHGKHKDGTWIQEDGRFMIAFVQWYKENWEKYLKDNF